MVAPNRAPLHPTDRAPIGQPPHTPTPPTITPHPINDRTFAAVFKALVDAHANQDQTAAAIADALVTEALADMPRLTPEQRAEALAYLGIEVAGGGGLGLR